MVNILKRYSQWPWVLAFLVLIGNATANDGTVIETPQIRIGELEHDETWSGQIHLVGDVVVPKNVTLTITAGSEIFFCESDLQNRGENTNKCEIVVLGRLDVQADPDHPVQLHDVARANVRRIENSGSVVLRFDPYQVDTTSMLDEFHNFKQQYLIFWSIVYAMWILAI